MVYVPVVGRVVELTVVCPIRDSHTVVHIFLKTTRFSIWFWSRVANEILENEPKSWLAVAYFIVDFYTF